MNTRAAHTPMTQRFPRPKLGDIAKTNSCSPVNRLMKRFHPPRRAATPPNSLPLGTATPPNTLTPKAVTTPNTLSPKWDTPPNSPPPFTPDASTHETPDTNGQNLDPRTPQIVTPQTPSDVGSNGAQATITAPPEQLPPVADVPQEGCGAIPKYQHLQQPQGHSNSPSVTSQQHHIYSHHHHQQPLTTICKPAAQLPPATGISSPLTPTGNIAPAINSPFTPKEALLKKTTASTDPLLARDTRRQTSAVASPFSPSGLPQRSVFHTRPAPFQSAYTRPAQFQSAYTRPVSFQSASAQNLAEPQQTTAPNPDLPSPGAYAGGRQQHSGSHTSSSICGYCERPAQVVVCMVCSYTFTGLVRAACPQHPNVLLLMAHDACPKCSSIGQLKEIKPAHLVTRDQ